jgi:hypothetical protein
MKPCPRLLRAALRALVTWSFVGYLAPLCGCGGTKAPSVHDAEPGSSLENPLELQLVTEKKLSKLLPSSELDHFEASGIIASNGRIYVAFDDATEVGIVDTSLGEGKLGPGRAENSQYEALTASDDERLFAISESSSETDTRGEVAVLDLDGALVSRAFADVAFEHPNKGFEGAAWLRTTDAEYLLALCENNACKDDDTTPGEGRIKLLAFDGRQWSTQTTIHVPEPVAFLDYSDLAILQLSPNAYQVAIVSHKSTALWLGTLNTDSFSFSGGGTFYGFPPGSQGERRYCSLEGVSFLGPKVLAFASDRSDAGADCDEEAESVHLFRLP